MENKSCFAVMKNSRAISTADVPVSDINEFRSCIIQAVKEGARIVSLFGSSLSDPDKTALYAVLADDQANNLYAAGSAVEGDGYPSLTPSCAQAHLFEREIAEQFGLKPEGHPWLKPVRYHHSWTGRDAWGRDKKEAIVPGSGSFYRVEGKQIHEVAVGPVHAGIIEPGHFRFQCHGEEVYHLEIALGYQHRGIEEAMIGGPSSRSLHYMETLAGDTTAGHASAYSGIIEALSNTNISALSQALRGIALELERLANHVGDLGALANDVGYLPTASFCGRIRGEYLNLTALLCGNRFGRGMIRPGGIGFNIDKNIIEDFKKRFKIIEKDTADAINLLWQNQSVLTRFENTGTITKETAVELGLVGPSARACGIARDNRYNMPAGIYCFANMPVSTYDSGDVFARAYVRWMEAQRSIEFIKMQINSLPTGDIFNEPGALQPSKIAVSLIEGWRGEICHTALTDDKGVLMRYKIVDPSFHNWMGLAMALRNQAISDFPLCNKSFNLSYCGHDL